MILPSLGVTLVSKEFARPLSLVGIGTEHAVYGIEAYITIIPTIFRLYDNKNTQRLDNLPANYGSMRQMAKSTDPVTQLLTDPTDS
ncbi:hypothetical protein RUM43_010495 [Polyplax serrata]|uniref:Uncharacterized protein n=1 Tax=Polyplax serrata TaxID=468196 RepID=A0AAN8Q4Z6_POLSC